MNAQINGSVEAVHNDSETAASIVLDLESAIRRSNALLHTLTNIMLSYEEGETPNKDFEGQRNAGIVDLVYLTIDQNRHDFEVAVDKANQIRTTAD